MNKHRVNSLTWINVYSIYRGNIKVEILVAISIPSLGNPTTIPATVKCEK